MPDLDLKPDDYKVRDPKSGRWFQRDSKPALIVGIAMCLLVLGIIWLRRGEITDLTALIPAVAIMGAGVGFFLARLSKNIH
jgi:hypothetical protein